MNHVNGSIALQTAHKLRSAAAALVADGERQLDSRLADSIMYEAGEIIARARQIEAQVRPAIVEPQEFGSIIQATSPVHGEHRWQQTPLNGRHYWMAETGDVEIWSELTDVTVLRVGLGVADEEKLDASFNDGLHEGQRDMNTRIHARLVSLHDLEVLKLRQRGLEKAMQAVEELAP